MKILQSTVATPEEAPQSNPFGDETEAEDEPEIRSVD